MGRGDLAGSAQLELVSGVAHLRPEDALFDAMLHGFQAQQLARGLRRETIEARRPVEGIEKPPTRISFCSQIRELSTLPPGPPIHSYS